MTVLLEEEQLLEIPSKEIVKMSLAELSLLEFIKQAWHILEPTTEFIYGWHLETICEHLEAVTRREIRNLIINIPPRYMKSLAVSVFWPCWVWTQNPSSRWLFSSYAQELSTRDSLKCRRILESNWYQANWGHKFQIEGDQNKKIRFDNNKTGFRIATSVSGLGTGEGGDYIIVDDPHNVKQAESELVRTTTLRWWDETMSSRFNNPSTGVRVIIMQRLNEDDLTGHVLEKETGYVHLRLPARFELENRCKTSIFTDPRTYDGEPLWKQMYDEGALTKLEKELGSEYAIAGQLQQRPSVRGGGLFKTEKFEYVRNVHPTDIVKSIRYWDKGGTTDKSNAQTSGTLMHKLKDNSFVVAHSVSGHWTAPKREQMILNIAKNDGIRVAVYVEQEPGSGGLESAVATIKNLAGYSCGRDKVTGSKEIRAEPYATQVEIGNVKLLEANWNKDFVAQHELFPMGKAKDMVDSASGAFNMLTRRSRAGAWGGANK